MGAGPRRRPKGRTNHAVRVSANEVKVGKFGDNSYTPWDLRSIAAMQDVVREDKQKLFRREVSVKASEMFTEPSSELNEITRIGAVDESVVEFQLLSDLTQKPETDRKIRLRRQVSNINGKTSKWEVTWRWWILKRSVTFMCLLGFATFIIMNLAFAGLWMIQEERCCGNPTQSFFEIFDFAIQTSTTIGYGGYVPKGTISNILVVLLSNFAVMHQTIFAGLIFLKFITPRAEIAFSDVLTLSNLNTIPCLEIRVGNADGTNNLLTNITFRLSSSHVLTFPTEDGGTREVHHAQNLELLQDRLHTMESVVTLRHILDETSPLFGVDFLTYPGNCIYEFRLSMNATQDVTKSDLTLTTAYQLQDLLIGHRFVENMEFDPETQSTVVDYAKLSQTVPSQVWYPVSRSKAKKNMVPSVLTEE